MISQANPPKRYKLLLQILWVVFLLYLFLVGIGLLGASFKLMGKGFSEAILQTTANPLHGLVIGILATSLMQSSSVTTSLVVGLVAGGGLTLTNAIPIIMGANIGTTVTNMIVSIGHISYKNEFKRAFAASTVHDFFNVLSVLVLFPVHLLSLKFLPNGGLIGTIATWLGEGFSGIGGLTFVSPIKLITKPAVHLLQEHIFGSHPAILIIVSILFIFIALRYLVTTLRSLVVSRVEKFFNEILFATALRGFLFGLVLTVMVQSSSITTSLAVPLAAAGLLTLVQIFPYTLGANVGTTITAILASFATGNIVAVTTAFSHLLFNVMGIAIIYPIPAVRKIPLWMSTALAELAVRNRAIPILFILVFFYGIPFSLILLWR